MKQLGLFAGVVDDTPRSPSDDAATRALSAKLPRALRFGTSSWSFAGWRGVVWPDEPGWSDARCARDGLPVYAKHPLLRAVGLDRSYYGPLNIDEATRHRGQVPDDFRFAVKVWEAITLRSLRDRPGVDNPRRFSPAAFVDEVLAPQRPLEGGPLLLEFPAGEPLDPERFPAELAAFLRAVKPRLGGFSMAVEVRDARLLDRALGRVLATHDVPLCFTFHPTMPPLAAQAAWAARHGLFEEGAAPIVVRLMLPRGETYEARRRAAFPFDRLIDRQEEMRSHVVDVIARAVRAGREVLVLVNNKAEGSAPLTIRALAERVAGG